MASQVRAIMAVRPAQRNARRLLPNPLIGFGSGSSLRLLPDVSDTLLAVLAVLAVIMFWESIFHRYWT
jgi:hypothetical protein